VSFQDLSEFFESSLRLPIRGKEYVVPSPDAETGLWVQMMMSTAAKAARGQDVDPEKIAALDLDDDEERGLFGRLLGSAFDEMIEDRIPWEHVKHAGMTALIWTNGTLEDAEKFWATAGQLPEAPAPNRETRRASKASGTTMRSRASTSGTRTRPKVIEGSVVPGRTSSGTGR